MFRRCLLAVLKTLKLSLFNVFFFLFLHIFHLHVSSLLFFQSTPGAASDVELEARLRKLQGGKNALQFHVRENEISFHFQSSSHEFLEM
jgi:hypothetical protein